MNISQSAGARPEWYDRNPVTKTASYNGVLAPAGNTVRLTYTTPAGKKAYVTNGYVSAVRVVAGGTPGGTYTFLNITPSGGSISNVILNRSYENAANVKVGPDNVTGIMLLPGDVMTFNTLDTSVGGSVDFAFSYVLTEFDA